MLAGMDGFNLILGAFAVIFALLLLSVSWKKDVLSPTLSKSELLVQESLLLAASMKNTKDETTIRVLRLASMFSELINLTVSGSEEVKLVDYGQMKAIDACLNAIARISDPRRSSIPNRVALVPCVQCIMRSISCSSKDRLSSALRAVKNFSQLKEMKMYLECNDGVSRIVDLARSSLRREKEGPLNADRLQDVDVQREVALILGILCDGGNDALKTKIADEGYITVAIESLDYYREHEHLPQWILLSLFNISYLHNYNKLEVIRNGAISVVICIMDRHPSSLPIQRQAIALLFSCLMKVDGLDVLRYREQARSQGIISAIQRAMREHPDPNVVSMGTALCNY